MKAHEVKKELQKSLLEAEVLDHVVVRWPQKEQPSSNSIWDEFGPVVRICDNRRVEVQESDAITITFVGCKKCSTPYSWTLSRGTQSLRKHNCPPKSVVASSSHSIVQWMVVKSCAAMCAVDMRPFAIVSGEGFQSLLQTVLDIGVASKNPIRIKDLLNDEVTVKRAAVKTYKTIRQVLIAKLQAHFQDKMVAGCTLDIWTEPLTSIAYMSVTMHYIDVDFKHNARTLQVDQFPEVSHTAVAILKTFKQCIIPFTGEFDSMNVPVKEQIRITTDHASNNCGEDGLPSEFQWNGCADHSISTCLSFVLDKRTSIVNGKKSKPYYQFYANAPAVFDMLDNCKALVTYVKRVGLNKQLTPKLKQAVATRWIATKELEAFKTPTLHLVTHWRKVLLEHCDIVDEERVVKDKDGVKVTLPPDSKDFLNIKDLIKYQILEKFMLTALHVATTYLDPRQKPIISELEIDDELQREAIAIIKSTMVQNSPPTLTIDDKRPVLATACNRHPRKRKRAAISVVFPCRCINDFSSNDNDDDQDDIDNVPNTATLEILVIAELQAYEAFTLSNAMSENNFSDSGSTVSKKRNQLKPSTVNILMFLRSNIDLTK
ncbi:hypothetical protein Mp_8g00340 [Marchantia polymorpha subsp. ruderalis]|uniref:Uncharacterized protein n=1 Tax=Marchantia polymorpha TaxID=3197 RepID=A0A2R6WLG4_MARPO|nr:hypothetical protein MARPO_0077s0035 [Marchantia polymorpha]BBN18176.1 hypothetical protein Mp_8g00340 [Marchantia polymorpha subsp. ruderalis]|eukprot:PTQ34706.1 hypothetical protein MARPO_0077s0035 [Marchantia polymorpha]